MSSLSSLVVDLQLNSAQLRKGLEDANAKLDQFGKRMDKLANLVTFEAIGNLAKDAAVGLAHFVQGGAESADKMGKLAQSAGIPVEALSRLAYAAELSDVSTQELGAGLGKLTKKMADAAAGGKSAAIFEALGVKVTDANGKMRDAGSVMADISEKFAGLEDGSAKAAIAQEIFGESGAKMIPLLNEGKEGLAAAAAEADKFGLTVTEKGAEAAGQFNDSLTKLKKAGEGLALRVAERIAPIMSKLIDEFLSGESGANAMKGAADALVVTLKALASGGAIIAGVFEAVGKVLAGVSAAVMFAIDGDFGNAKHALGALGEDLAKGAQETKKRLEAIWADDSGATKAAEKMANKAKRSADPIIRQIQVSKHEDKAGDDEAGNLQMQQAKDGISRLAELAMLARKREMDAAKKAADEAERMAKESAEAADRLQKSFSDLADQGIDKVLSRLGALGEVIGSGKNAFKSVKDAGGTTGQAVESGIATGALDAAFMAIDAIVGIFTRAKSLTEAIDIFGEAVDVVSEAMSIAYEPVRSVAVIVKTLAMEGLGRMRGSLESFAKTLEAFLPNVYLIGEILVQAQVAWTSIADQFKGVGIDAGAKFLFDAMKFAATAVMTTAKSIIDVWNGIVNAIGSLLNNLGFGEAAAEVWKKRLDTTILEDSLSVLAGLTYTQVQATVENIIATERMANAAEKATASFTNIPSGVKVALARFNAANSDKGVHVADFGESKSGGNTGIVINGNVMVQNSDPKKLYEDIKREARRVSFQRSGSAVATSGTGGFVPL